MWQYSNSKTMRRLLIKLFTKGSTVCLEIISDSRKMDYLLLIRKLLIYMRNGLYHIDQIYKNGHMRMSKVYKYNDVLVEFGQKWPNIYWFLFEDDLEWPYVDQFHMIWFISDHNPNLNARFESLFNFHDSFETVWLCILCFRAR